MKLSPWIFISLSTFIYSCSTVPIEIVSQPSPAEVFLESTEEPAVDPSLIGQTPIRLELDKISLSSPWVFTFKKKGFQTKEVFIPSEDFLKDKPQIAITLKSSQPPPRPLVRVKVVFHQYEMIKYNIHRKKYSAALRDVNDLIKRDPEVPTFYELQGTIYFMQKRYRKAKLAWKKAIKLSPHPRQLKEILQLLERVEV